MSYVVVLGRRYLEEVEGVASWRETIDPDKARVFDHRDRAENVARLVGGRVAERL